jgi:hypothetical protein|tara:strand:+ start:280 stop:1251 length:972 start_codon:yes stop_codon:yes gene_type:complete
MYGRANYSNGFKNGVNIRGVPVEIPHPGEVFWVNGSSVLAKRGIGGSNSNDGSYHKPFSTIDYAVGKCTASRGDVIYVMPGHTETISGAATLDLDVAGITIIGLGTGTLQPRLDFTATGSTVEVNADNISIYNMNFHANISAVVIGLSVLTLATDLIVSGCKFDVEATTTDEFVIAINFGVGCDRFLVENCEMDMGLGGAATGIKLVGATAGGTIRGNRIVGDYSQACIAGITTLSTEIYIEENMLINGASGNVGALEVIEMLTGTTGVVRRNTWLCNVGSIVLESVADTMYFSENYAGEDVGAAASSVLRSGAASVTASADD